MGPIQIEKNALSFSFTLERLLFLSLGKEFLRKYSCMLQLNQLYLIHQRALDFGRDQSKSDRKCLCDFVSYIFFAGVSICCNRSEDEYNLYSSLCGVDEVHLCGNVPLHHHHCPQCSHYPQVIFYPVRIFHYGKKKGNLKKIILGSLKDKIHLALEENQ